MEGGGRPQIQSIDWSGHSRRDGSEKRWLDPGREATVERPKGGHAQSTCEVNMSGREDQ